MKTYETESVPIPRKKKWTNISVSGACAVFGAAILGNGILDKALDKSAAIIWGALIVVSGAFFLVRSIRQTHERVITAAGKAAKLVDERLEAQRRARRNSDLMGWAFIAGVIAAAAYFFEPIADLFHQSHGYRRMRERRRARRRCDEVHCSR
jgi:TRAP-type C4-dicarboxylate transport system permease small subunit